MAYVFNTVNNQLEQQKANIFGGQPGAQQGGPGASSPMDSGAGPTPTSSGGTGAKPSGSAPQTSSQQTQSTINKASRSIQTPGAVSKIGGNLQSAQQKVQDEANAYTQGAQNKSFNLEQGQLEAAASGDQAEMGNVGGRLNQQMADRAEAFQPKTEYNLQDVADIQSNPGIKNMYRREVGPQYGRGESAFDAMLLQKNPEFQKTRAQLVQQQQALTSDVNKKKVDLSEGAQKSYDENFARDTGDIRNRLGGIGESQLDAARKYAEEVNARRAGIDIGQVAGSEEQQIAQSLQQELTGAGGTDTYARAGKLLSNKDLLDQINEQDFIRKGGNVGMEDVINEDQSSKFNRVMGLLGDKRAYQAGMGPGEDVTRDTGGLRNALKDRAVRQRQQMDAQQEAKLRDLQSQLNNKAYGLTSSRNKAMDNLRNNLLAEISAASSMSTMNPNTGGIQSPVTSAARDPRVSGGQLDAIRNLNLQNYGAYGQNAGWRDLIDQSNMGDVNATYEDLGWQDRVGAGAGVTSDFDKQRLYQDILNTAGVDANFIGGRGADYYTQNLPNVGKIQFPTIDESLLKNPQLSGSGPLEAPHTAWVGRI